MAFFPTSVLDPTVLNEQLKTLFAPVTASGSIATFDNGGDDIPVSEYECEIVASGFTQADIVVCGKNLFDRNNLRRGTFTNADGSTISAEPTQNVSSQFIKVKPNTTYNVILYNNSYIGGSISAIYYDNNKIGTNQYTALQSLTADTAKQFTTPNNASWVVFSCYRSTGTDVFLTYDLMVTDSNELQSFVPYTSNIYTITFGATFNSGNLVYKNGEWFIDDNGTITPITSSTRVKTISGNNNIYSNTGDCEVKYFTNKADSLAELIKAFVL